MGRKKLDEPAEVACPVCKHKEFDGHDREHCVDLMVAHMKECHPESYGPKNNDLWMVRAA